MPIPDMSPDDHSLNVPNAFKAWAAVSNELGFGCMQVHDARTRDGATRGRILREVYTRAILQQAIGLHFDLRDTHTDVHVYQQIVETFGPLVADLIHTDVARVGPVGRDLAAMHTMLSIAEVP